VLRGLVRPWHQTSLCISVASISSKIHAEVIIHTCTLAYSKLLISHYSTKQQLYANVLFFARFLYECVKLEVVASPRNWADGLNWLQLKPIDRYVLNSLHNKFNAGGWAQGREGEMCPDKNAMKAGLHSRGLGIRPWDECGTCRHTRLYYPACSAFSSVAGSNFDVFECFLWSLLCSIFISNCIRVQWRNV